MIRHGQPPFLECSTRGDKRFSAFNARIRARGNKSIEEIYQAAKVFDKGVTGLTWQEAKGKKAVNAEEVTKLYSELWNEYIKENVELIEVLVQATGLSDMFGQPNHCCQATELFRIQQAVINHRATKK
jgi:sulfatase maturation enzyme AslB (radical SAM superfamily)